MFAHKRYEHFKGNVGFLFLLLCWYEIEHGKRRLAGVILFGAIGGCIGHAIARDTNLMGASAVIWALVMANIIAPRHKKVMELLERIANFKESELKLTRRILLICTGGYLIFEALYPQEASTSFPSHLGGAFAGIVFEVIVATTKALMKRQCSDASSKIEENNPLFPLWAISIQTVLSVPTVGN
jgi:membrane associated rhomboid family serine protease